MYIYIHIIGHSILGSIWVNQACSTTPVSQTETTKPSFTKGSQVDFAWCVALPVVWNSSTESESKTTRQDFWESLCVHTGYKNHCLSDFRTTWALVKSGCLDNGLDSQNDHSICAPAFANDVRVQFLPFWAEYMSLFWLGILPWLLVENPLN